MLLVDKGLEPQDDFNLLLRLRGTMGEFYPPETRNLCSSIFTPTQGALPCPPLMQSSMHSTLRGSR